MPDLLGYFLTGEKKSEYTEATTSMLYNPTTKDWDWQTIEALELPKRSLRRSTARKPSRNAPSGAGGGTGHQPGAFRRCRHARHSLCCRRHPRHGQLRVLLQRHMVAVRRGDGQADPDGRRARRELLE